MLFSSHGISNLLDKDDAVYTKDLQFAPLNTL